MGRRDKTKFEKWFSFSRHKRRFGAKLKSNDIPTDFKNQKKIIINSGKKKYTHGSANDISVHFSALKSEFSGQSYLCWTHAKIIVLIRREFKSDEHFLLFEKLWKEEKKFLLKSLNTRWLISAADTFFDYSPDNTTRALSIACSCLVNTIKLQETERYITNCTNKNDDDERVDKILSDRLSLFDGTSAFTVGTDDTIRNMRWRLDKIATTSITGEILLEIFSRLQSHNTVYSRFKDRHKRSKTGWW